MGPHGILGYVAVRFFKLAVKVLRCHILENYAALHPWSRSNGGGGVSGLLSDFVNF
jgi:hypothetical protein